MEARRMSRRRSAGGTVSMSPAAKKSDKEDQDAIWRMQYVDAGFEDVKGPTPAASTGAGPQSQLDGYLSNREAMYQLTRQASEASRIRHTMSQWMTTRRVKVEPKRGCYKDVAWRWLLIRSYVLQRDFISEYLPKKIATVAEAHVEVIKKKGAPPPQPPPVPHQDLDLTAATPEDILNDLVTYRQELKEHLQTEWEPMQTPPQKDIFVEYASKAAKHCLRGDARYAPTFAFSHEFYENAYDLYTNPEGSHAHEDLRKMVNEIEGLEHLRLEEREDLDGEDKRQRIARYGDRVRDGLTFGYAPSHRHTMHESLQQQYRERQRMNVAQQREKLKQFASPPANGAPGNESNHSNAGATTGQGTPSGRVGRRAVVDPSTQSGKVDAEAAATATTVCSTPPRPRTASSTLCETKADLLVDASTASPYEDDQTGKVSRKVHKALSSELLAPLDRKTLQKMLHRPSSSLSRQAASSPSHSTPIEGKGKTSSLDRQAPSPLDPRALKKEASATKKSPGGSGMSPTSSAFVTVGSPSARSPLPATKKARTCPASLITRTAPAGDQRTPDRGNLLDDFDSPRHSYEPSSPFGKKPQPERTPSPADPFEAVAPVDHGKAPPPPINPTMCIHSKVADWSFLDMANLMSVCEHEPKYARHMSKADTHSLHAAEKRLLGITDDSQTDRNGSLRRNIAAKGLRSGQHDENAALLREWPATMFCPPEIVDPRGGGKEWGHSFLHQPHGGAPSYVSAIQGSAAHALRTHPHQHRPWTPGVHYASYVRRSPSPEDRIVDEHHAENLRTPPVDALGDTTAFGRTTADFGATGQGKKARAHHYFSSPYDAIFSDTDTTSADAVAYGAKLLSADAIDPTAPRYRKAALLRGAELYWPVSVVRLNNNLLQSGQTTRRSNEESGKHASPDTDPSDFAMLPSVLEARFGWLGVHYITTLDLAENKLSSLPPELARAAPNLRALYLHSNIISSFEPLFALVGVCPTLILPPIPVLTPMISFVRKGVMQKRKQLEDEYRLKVKERNRIARKRSSYGFAWLRAVKLKAPPPSLASKTTTQNLVTHRAGIGNRTTALTIQRHRKDVNQYWANRLRRQLEHLTLNGNSIETMGGGTRQSATTGPGGKPTGSTGGLGQLEERSVYKANILFAFPFLLSLDKSPILPEDLDEVFTQTQQKQLKG